MIISIRIYNQYDCSKMMEQVFKVFRLSVIIFQKKMAEESIQMMTQLYNIYNLHSGFMRLNIVLILMRTQQRTQSILRKIICTTEDSREELLLPANKITNNLNQKIFNTDVVRQQGMSATHFDNKIARYCRFSAAGYFFVQIILRTKSKLHFGIYNLQKWKNVIRGIAKSKQQRLLLQTVRLMVPYSIYLS